MGDRTSVSLVGRSWIILPAINRLSDPPYSSAGVDLTGRYQSELSIFDILANRWLDLSAPSLAHLHSRQARFLHAASVLELAEHRHSPKLYITGGYAEQTHCA